MLLDELLPLVDAAARNVDTYHAFLQCMPAMRHAVQHNAVLPIPVGATGRTPQIEREDGQASRLTFTEDQQHIRGLLGVSYKIDHYDGDVLEGRTIAIKYGNKAWWLAEVIHEHMGPEHARSHELKYVVDNQEGEANLNFQTLWDFNRTDKAPRWSWLLLGEASVSNHAQYDKVTEPACNNAGRKAVNRRAPPVGPTSKPKKRR